MDIILFVVGVVALLLAALAVFAAETPLQKIGATTGFGALAALCVSGAFTYTLKANEIGLEISRGRIGDVSGPGGNPNGFLGTYGKAPWTGVEKFSALPYTGESVDITMRTRDGGDFAARFTPRWHTDAQRAKTLYQQANRTSDESEITKNIVHLYLRGVAGDVANTVPTDNVVDPGTGKVTETGVANLSTLDFSRKVAERLAPVLAQKGIVLDEVTVNGAFVLSEKMREQLEALAASRSKTLIANEDEATAASEARAAKARAGAATNVPVLNPEQVKVFCAQVWAAEAKRATERGVPLYTTPCDGTGSGLLVGAK